MCLSRLKTFPVDTLSITSLWKEDLYLKKAPVKGIVSKKYIIFKFYAESYKQQIQKNK